MAEYEYEKAYKNLFSFLLKDEDSPIKFDPFKVGGSQIYRYDGNGDVVLHQFVREYVMKAQKMGINPWENLKFGFKVKGTEWGDTPRVEFLPENPKKEGPIFTFYIRYNWGK